VMRLLY